MAGLPSGTAQATLPWSWYVEPDVLEREREHIFGHAWRYVGPARTARADELGGRLETWGPLAFVNADADAEPLARNLGPLPGYVADGGIELDRLRFRRRAEFELACNWKIAIENYLECYHCPTAHPGFSAVVDVSPDAYRLETQARSSSQFGPLRPGREGGAITEGQFHWLWPVTKVYAMPGPENLVAGSVAPLGPQRTTGFVDYFFPDHVSEKEVEELVAFDDQVGREDRQLVDSVQRGVGSGMLDGGRLMPESERLLTHFQALVREALE